MQSAWFKTVCFTIVSILGSVVMTCVLCIAAGMDDWVFSISAAVICPLFLAPPVAYVSFRQNDRVQHLLAELKIAHETLSERVRRDALTGLLNRSAFMSESESAVDANAQNALLLLDADHFKAINDRFGHIAGDAALAEIAAVMTRVVGERGFAGRVGGEEFAVLLPNATVDELLEAAEAIRVGVEASDVQAADMMRMPLTVSIGAVLGWRNASFIELYAEADRRLYEAKRSGRNRIEIGKTLPLAAA